MSAYVGIGETSQTPVATGDFAMVTPSFSDDFERCRLLCDTMDKYAEGFGKHYLLVEGRDVQQFRALESARRIVVDERDILPKWLHAVTDPISSFHKRVQPLRGWHVQQLRRIALAAHVPEEVLIYCDSDVTFLKPFNVSGFRKDGKVRLFRRDNGLVNRERTGHDDWNRHAGEILGLPKGAMTQHDYISTLIAWRRQSVLDMCAQMEAVTGKHWVRAVASSRKFSECMFYGRYVDEVAQSAHHFHGSQEWCSVAWFGEEMGEQAFRAHLAGMSAEQAAICVQSFIKIDLNEVRRIVDV